MTVYDSSVRAVRALLVVANRTCFTRCASQSSRHPCRILDQLRVRPARYSNPEYVGDLCDAWYSLERSPLHSALGLVIIDPRNREPPLLEARILLFYLRLSSCLFRDVLLLGSDRDVGRCSTVRQPSRTE